MPGTIAGGKAAAATNKAKYGDDFYEKIGAIGGRKGTTGGFHQTMCVCDYQPVEHKKASCAGYKGGRKSKRGPKQPQRPDFFVGGRSFRGTDLPAPTRTEHNSRVLIEY